MAHYFVVAGEEDFERYKSDYEEALADKIILGGIIARSLRDKEKLYRN